MNMLTEFVNGTFSELLSNRFDPELNCVVVFILQDASGRKRKKLDISFPQPQVRNGQRNGSWIT